MTSNFLAHIANLTTSTRSSIDSLLDTFNNKSATALDAVAPLKIRKTVRERKTPWKKHETTKLKRDCRIADRRWRKTKLQVHKEILAEK